MRKHKVILLLMVVINGFLFCLIYQIKKKDIPQPKPPANFSPNEPDIAPNRENPSDNEPEIITPLPEFTEEPPLRNVDSNLGKVLSDIESHMPRGHLYRDKDKITWGHETTHGIHSRLRMKYSGVNKNVMYVLKNRSCIIKEPNTTIRKAAQVVPRSLRGGVYNLYMVEQARSWNNTPLYVFDEWVAYGNGAAVRADLNIQNRQKTVLYMLEFNNYAIAVAMASKTEDKQFKNFLMYNLKRSMELYEKNGNLPASDAYLEKTRKSPNAEKFRSFARNYFGKKWTKKVLGY